MAGQSQERTGQTDVEFRSVTKRFGAVVAVDDVDLRIRAGSFYSLLGPSGCGKTTSLRMIAGFEDPTAGEIFIGGEPVLGVPPYRRQVNTVFQHYALFPHMDVGRNVGYGLRQRRVPREEQERRVQEALDLVRLSAYGRRRVWELSGGQQQRVALARALINHPTVLLLDEPLGALDLKLRKEMQLELKALQHQVGITFVYVTHDQEEAITMSDRIAVMRDGRIQQEGTPTELYDEPANRFVASFLGQSNFFEGELLEDGELAGVRTARGLILWGRRPGSREPLAAGSRATVAIRPERISLAGDPPADAAVDRETATLPGRVLQGTYLGDQSEYQIETDALGPLMVRSINSEGLPAAHFGAGAAVRVAWRARSSLVLGI
ncbi:MAG: spermidine/putrescine ABC transporter ATP-binding protein [Chloroflexi bacterium GWC2_73_18]|nr:MAG: spermidine/putrescine ABC transporter ATP-binding protein [Chloroflexi bacterium GWC2_73_18]